MAIIQRSIVLTKPQLAWLKSEAKRLGISIAEVIRRALDEKRDNAKKTPAS